MRGARTFFALLFVAVAAAIAWYFMRPGTDGASVQPFVGSWRNEAASPGITRIVIKPASRREPLDIRMWGRCHPQDCDWGHPHSIDYGKAAAGRVDLVWRPGFAERSQSMARLADGRLQVVTHTRFTDRSKRRDYTTTEFFRPE